MKKWLFALLPIASLTFAQSDPKEASSDAEAVLEGRLRDSKPNFERSLPDGTKISVWAMAASGSAKKIVKAIATRETTLSNEGKTTEKADFIYVNGAVSEMLYTQMQIVQTPNPSVTSKKKQMIFTEGVQTSPPPGSFPEIDAFVNGCLSEISKITLTN